MIALLATGCGTSKPDKPLLDSVNLAKARQLIETSKATGQIAKFSCVGNEAYVNPLTWQSFTIDQKRGMAISLTAICEAENSGRYITIMDNMSGKRLARFDGDRLSVD